WDFTYSVGLGARAERGAAASTRGSTENRGATWAQRRRYRAAQQTDRRPFGLLSASGQCADLPGDRGAPHRRYAVAGPSVGLSPGRGISVAVSVLAVTRGIS